tara:strand:- start:806 stop:973 length:168 start_codon:yes stop_codon:yes gene_type:complete
MSNLNIWKEGDLEWTWPEGESVPRYKHSQMTPDTVVQILNKAVEVIKIVKSIPKK